MSSRPRREGRYPSRRGIAPVPCTGLLWAQADELLQRRQEVRHLVLAPEWIAVPTGQLANAGGVLLGQPPRLVEQLPPLRGRHAGDGEDGEGTGDGRAQGGLIPQLAGEVLEEGTQLLPLLAAADRAAAARPAGDLPAAGDQVGEARRLRGAGGMVPFTAAVGLTGGGSPPSCPGSFPLS